MNYGKKPINEYLKFYEPHSKNHGVVAVDQEKFNFIWLNYPEIEQHGLEAVPQAAIDSVCTCMDVGTRAALKKRPLDFMRYWSAIDTGYEILGLTEHMAPGYRATMWARAEEAQARLAPVRRGNVIEVRFGGHV